MGAKHRMTGRIQQRPSRADGGARRALSGVAGACEVIAASVLCASAVGLIVNVEPEKRSLVADEGPAPVSQPVRQQGTVIAVSADSVTARSPDGYTQTYLLTPDTAVITRAGAHTATAPGHFALNDHVDIVGTIRGGTALATTVSDQDAGRGDGPPMDFDVAQPASTAPGAA